MQQISDLSPTCCRTALSKKVVLLVEAPTFEPPTGIRLGQDCEFCQRGRRLAPLFTSAPGFWESPNHRIVAQVLVVAAGVRETGDRELVGVADRNSPT